MENLVINRDFWKSKRVLVTGHTGFKGGWLSLWLSDMGSKVYGYSLDPPTEPNFFTLCRLGECLEGHFISDIRDGEMLNSVLLKSDPEIVFHLAAQPLVQYSYKDPVLTYSTNIMGTVNLLEAVRQNSNTKVVINVTTDKCYENHEWLWPYRENDVLGGSDPYSSSKACSEIITSAYIRSFFMRGNTHIGSARAGNVIGGGDWASDRLIPDFLRALHNNQKLIVRSPNAIRPWQHVLEPLSGYLMLAQAMFEKGGAFAGAWNFGPDESSICTVEWILNYLCKLLPSASWQKDMEIRPKEACILKLDSTKSRNLLGWSPRWNLKRALEKVIEWDSSFQTGQDMNKFSLYQIHEFESIKVEL